MDLLIGKCNAGDYIFAESLARAMTVKYPNFLLGWNALGISLHRRGKFREALVPMRQAVVLSPRDPMLRSNLGATLIDVGLLEEAEANFRKSIKLNPAVADAHNNLGLVMQRRGCADEAERCYHEALRLNPQYFEAYNNLGSLFDDLDRLSLAEDCFRRSLELNQNFGEAHSNLGKVLRKRGFLKEAEESCRMATRLNPSSFYAQLNLGNALRELGRIKDAEDIYLQALRLDANNSTALNNLAIVLQQQGRLSEAEQRLRMSLEILPDNSRTHRYLGGVLNNEGRFVEAQGFFREALRLRPDFFDALSGLLFSLNYSTSYSPSEALDLAIGFGKIASAKARQVFSSWACTQETDRIRVGFVSGDLRNHPVGYFLEGMLSQLQSSSMELVAFTTNPTIDELTLRVKPYFKEWFPIYGLTDQEAANLIHQAAPHILIDLSGHTAHGRLPVFAYKPAPVQVTWLGYFATTGMTEMDYVLASQISIPFVEESHFTEKVWRLPETSLCFSPPDSALHVTALPAKNNGFVTFGCFNNWTKINERVLSIWIEILNRVPDSKLFLKTKQFADQKIVADLLALFSNSGVNKERLILEGYSERNDYLAAYHRVDIALDPFPFPGGATTVEALWMGVPVLTIKGERFISHQGEVIAHNAGLFPWIADDQDDYIVKAQQFASNMDALATLRKGLREQVLKSPLFDAKRFALHFEEAVRGMLRDRDFP